MLKWAFVGDIVVDNMFCARSMTGRPCTPPLSTTERRRVWHWGEFGSPLSSHEPKWWPRQSDEFIRYPPKTPVLQDSMWWAERLLRGSGDARGMPSNEMRRHFGPRGSTHAARGTGHECIRSRRALTASAHVFGIFFPWLVGSLCLDRFSIVFFWPKKNGCNISAKSKSRNEAFLLRGRKFGTRQNGSW